MSLFRRTLRGLERAVGPQHHDVAAVLHNLATLQHACGRLAEAEPSYQRSLALTEQDRSAEAVHLCRQARHIFATT